MVFNAAKDLVYTMNGDNISSGGYRISKILNEKSINKIKKKPLKEVPILVKPNRKGKVKEIAGVVVGDMELEAKGKVQNIGGKAQFLDQLG